MCEIFMQLCFLLFLCANPLFSLPSLFCILIIKSLINIFQLIFICCRRHFFVHLCSKPAHMRRQGCTSHSFSLSPSLPYYLLPSFIVVVLCMPATAATADLSLSVSRISLTDFHSSRFWGNLSSWRTHCQAHRQLHNTPPCPHSTTPTPPLSHIYISNGNA